MTVAEIRRRLAVLRAERQHVARAIAALEQLEQMRLGEVVEMRPHALVMEPQRLDQSQMLLDLVCLAAGGVVWASCWTRWTLRSPSTSAGPGDVLSLAPCGLDHCPGTGGCRYVDGCDVRAGTVLAVMVAAREMAWRGSRDAVDS